jgi:hypothetical protein
MAKKAKTSDRQENDKKHDIPGMFLNENFVEQGIVINRRVNVVMPFHHVSFRGD